MEKLIYNHTVTHSVIASSNSRTNAGELCLLLFVIDFFLDFILYFGLFLQKNTFMTHALYLKTAWWRSFRIRVLNSAIVSGFTHSWRMLYPGKLREIINKPIPPRYFQNEPRMNTQKTHDNACYFATKLICAAILIGK